MLKAEKRAGRERSGELLKLLRAWRDEQARREGVEPFRVLPNATLNALAERRPTSTRELLEVKGIKEAKQHKYGKALLEILHGNLMRDDRNLSGENTNTEESVTDGFSESIIDPLSSNVGFPSSLIQPPSFQTLSVSQFLDSINVELSGMAARVKGEVSSVNETTKAVYFSLKDAEDGSVLNCVIFQYQYSLMGVRLVEGDEIVVEGVPEIYKPFGKFNLRVGVVEYAGEGALKKAYDELKRKLEVEGIFAPERKRPLPELVERIALVTSADGAAIGDFLTNVGQNGLVIRHYPTLVEGKKAVSDLLSALEYFGARAGDYDCLVLVRGGGSLESLQAFNTEALARAVANFPIPLICGVGHERDITLTALAADVMVSTPTAAAKCIADPWTEKRLTLVRAEERMMDTYAFALRDREHWLRGKAGHLVEHFRALGTAVRLLESRWQQSATMVGARITRERERLDRLTNDLMTGFQGAWLRTETEVQQRVQALRQYDPQRLLALGYSLVRSGRAIIRSSQGLRVGDRLTIQFHDGGVESEVKGITET